MPKRKREDNYEYFKYKLKKLEKKLRRNKRKQRHDSSDSSLLLSTEEQSLSEPQDDEHVDFMVLTDEENTIDNRPDPSSVTVRPEASTLLPSATEILSNNITEDPSLPVALEPSADLLTTVPTVMEETGLDSDLLEILGVDPTPTKTYGKEIQKDLSIRLEHYATKGITKDLRKELKDKYLTPINCKLIDPPEINAELKAAVSDNIYKRDKAIEGKQKQLSAAISCLGEAITYLMTAKEKDNVLLKLLIDAARLTCDCQHADTVTRRNFLMNSVNKDMREQLQNTKIEKSLFGDNFTDTLKAAKAINKSSADLKIPAPKAPTKKFIPNTDNTSKNLNWKRPGPARRQQLGPPRTKEPATNSTRRRPTNSSKPSQHQQQRPNNNRR